MTTITKPAIFPEVVVAKPLSKVSGGNKGDVSGNENAAIKKTSQDFEALFVIFVNCSKNSVNAI